MDNQRLEEIARRLVESLRDLDADESGELDRRASVPLVMAAIQGALSSHAEELRLARGAIAAQDERERTAAAACGVPYEPHGCDWPHAVAERVQALKDELRQLREERDAAVKEAKRLHGLYRTSDPLTNLYGRVRDRVLSGACSPEDAHLFKGVLEAFSRWGDDEAPLTGAPHITDEQADKCPTWYDCCHCSVETLTHNIKRAESAEAELLRLRSLPDPVEAFYAHNMELERRVQRLESSVRELRLALRMPGYDAPTKPPEPQLRIIKESDIPTRDGYVSWWRRLFGG